MSPLKTHLLKILSAHRGVERRISRKSLKAEVGKRIGPLRDREMRAAIEDLRRGHAQGVWICADLRGGYFLARDKREIERYLSSDERRATRLLERLQLQRKTIHLQASSQIELFN
jgi:hypothetical protein